MPPTRLCLGTAQLGNPVSGGKAGSGDVHAMHLLQAAYELGIGAFDTEPAPNGSERKVGAFLVEHGLHEEIAVAIKLPSLAAAETARIAQRVEECVIASLRRLCCEVVDTCLIRAASDLERHGEALVDALMRQVDKGRLLALGLVADAPRELGAVETHPDITVVQHPFSLLDRRLLEGSWPTRLAARGVRLQLTRPLCGGLIGTPPAALDPARATARDALVELDRILVEFGLAALDAALPFALSIDPDSVVVTADTRERLERLNASQDVLPIEFLAAVEHRLGVAVPGEIVDGRPEPR